MPKTAASSLAVTASSVPYAAPGNAKAMCACSISFFAWALEPALEILLRKGDRFLTSDVARKRKHGARGNVELVLISSQVLRGQRIQALAGAEDGLFQRIALEKCGGQLLHAQVVGSVLALAQLLEHHFPLLFELGGVKSGVEIHVGEHVQALRRVHVAGKGVIACAALGGVGVDLRAQRVDVVCDVERRAGLRPLEEHVLDEVGDAGALRRFIDRSRPHEHACGDRPHRGIGSHDQLQPAVKSDQFVHAAIIPHITARANIICSMKERRFRTFTSNLIICVVLGAVLVTALFAVTDAGEAVITGGAVYEGDRDGGKVALMFNVYEGTEYVEEIARLLSERGMSATFFLGGIWAERNGDTVIRLAADGFELGNHGYLHRNHAALSAERNRSEIVVTERLLSATLSDLPSEERAAALPKLFAPPSGSMGDAMHAVCEQLGYTVVMWTRDTIDWRDHDAALITERALRDLAAGDLILMHPTAATVQALPAVLDGIAAAGLTADTVTAVLGGA